MAPYDHPLAPVTSSGLLVSAGKPPALAPCRRSQFPGPSWESSSSLPPPEVVPPGLAWTLHLRSNGPGDEPITGARNRKGKTSRCPGEVHPSSQRARLQRQSGGYRTPIRAHRLPPLEVDRPGEHQQQADATSEYHHQDPDLGLHPDRPSAILQKEETRSDCHESV